MSDARLQIQMPGVDFAGMARELIAAEFTKALLGKDEVITSIVVGAMALKVNDDGTKSRYDYENKTPYVEWMARDMIRKVALEVLKQKAEEMRPAIASLVEKELKKKTKAIAAALAGAFAERAGYAGIKLTLAVEQEHNK